MPVTLHTEVYDILASVSVFSFPYFCFRTLVSASVLSREACLGPGNSLGEFPAWTSTLDVIATFTACTCQYLLSQFSPAVLSYAYNTKCRCKTVESKKEQKCFWQFPRRCYVHCKFELMVIVCSSIRRYIASH